VETGVAGVPAANSGSRRGKDIIAVRGLSA
jgi:hypothetical protein